MADNSMYQHLRVTNPHLRRNLDSRGSVSHNGSHSTLELSGSHRETGGEGPEISMNPAHQGEANLSMGMMMHAGLMKDLKSIIKYMGNIVGDMEKIDSLSADLMYEAIAKTAMVQEHLDRNEVKVVISEGDNKRKSAFGEYWRNNVGKISRY